MNHESFVKWWLRFSYSVSVYVCELFLNQSNISFMVLFPQGGVVSCEK